MSDPPGLPLRGRAAGGNNLTVGGALVEPASGATNMQASTRSDEAQARDNSLADISERLDECHLDESATNDSTPSLAHTKYKPESDEPRTGAIAYSGLGVESNISNSQITPGRDMNMNLFNVNGTFIQVIQKCEESPPQQPERTATNTDKGASGNGRNYVNDEDDIAAGMGIPAPPPCILERDAQHNEIVSKLISIDNARVAILGMGGIGKTTLACSIADDSKIMDAYPRRLFLSFEGCSTADLAYSNLASAFQIPTDRRSSHRQILSQVSAYLKQQKTLFILDNFETFWEVSSNRRAAEELLAQLATLPKLAMIVTLRGIQRPGIIRWIKIDPLQTLSEDGSMELLSVITDEEYGDNSDSEYVQKLLNAVAGIPLAVTIIGSLLRDESETPRSLWAQWTRESARAIRVANDVDSDDRLYKLDISLRLSIFGPRMSDNAKAALAAISILPTGMIMDEEWLDRFQNLLLDTIRIRDCIRVLRDVALATLDSSTTPPRLRLLPPVRDFCLVNLYLDNVLSRRLIDIYNTDMDGHWDFGLSKNYSWVTTELSNINAILNHAIALRYVTDDFGWAVCRYTEWRTFLCMLDTSTIERAIDILSEHPEAKAQCLRAFGTELSNSNRKHEAVQQLERALSIHTEFGPKYELGWDLYLLGIVHSYLQDYAKAEHYLNEARDLTTEAADKGRKRSVLRALSNTYLAQNKLVQAQNAVTEALQLARATGSRRGEANALGVLGDVYRRMGEYDLAVEALTAGTNASKELNDIHGEACGNDSLGLLYCDINKPSQAAIHFRLAVSLYERAQDPSSADIARASLAEIEASSIPSQSDVS